MNNKEKIRRIKLSRVSPQEVWFLDVIRDMKIYKQKKYKNSIFWENKDTILFEQDNLKEKIFVNNKFIIQVLEDEFDIEYPDSGKFVNEMLEKHTELMNFKVHPKREYYWEDVIRKTKTLFQEIKDRLKIKYNL